MSKPENGQPDSVLRIACHKDGFDIGYVSRQRHFAVWTKDVDVVYTILKDFENEDIERRLENNTDSS